MLSDHIEAFLSPIAMRYAKNVSGEELPHRPKKNIFRSTETNAGLRSAKRRLNLVFHRIEADAIAEWIPNIESQL